MNEMMYYKSKPCFIKPFLVEPKNIEIIKQNIACGIARFLEKHMEIGKNIEFFGIKPVLEEISEYDFEEYFKHEVRRYVIKGIEYNDKKEAYEVFKNTYKKCVVEFRYADDECMHF